MNSRMALYRHYSDLQRGIWDLRKELRGDYPVGSKQEEMQLLARMEAELEELTAACPRINIPMISYSLAGSCFENTDSCPYEKVVPIPLTIEP